MCPSLGANVGVQGHSRQKTGRRSIDLTSISLAAVVAYLGAHAVTGRQGVGSAMELAEQESRLTRELAELQARRAQLSDEVKRLREPSLDLDLLEERARVMLNAAHPDELILTPPNG